MVVANRTAPTTLPPNDTGSIFDLPRAGGPRRARIALVIALDLLLAGAGIAMIVSYMNSRSEAAAKVEQASASNSTKNDAPTVGDTTNKKPGPTAIDGVKRPDGNSSAGNGGTSATSATGKPPAKVAKDPPVKDPPVKDPPVKDPPKKDPPVKDPPKKDPPAKDPPVKDPPDPNGAGSGSGAGAGSGSGSGSGSGEPGEPTEDEVGRFAGRIEGTVSRNQGSLSRCYSQAAKTHSQEDPLEGRVDIRFRIMPNEGVERVRAVKNTTGSELLASCLVSHVKTWRFPGGPSAPLDFVWPFRFRPKN